jgi:hypothetical protein
MIIESCLYTAKICDFLSTDLVLARSGRHQILAKRPAQFSQKAENRYVTRGERLNPFSGIAAADQSFPSFS